MFERIYQVCEAIFLHLEWKSYKEAIRGHSQYFRAIRSISILPKILSFHKLARRKFWKTFQGVKFVSFHKQKTSCLNPLCDRKRQQLVPKNLLNHFLFPYQNVCVRKWEVINQKDANNLLCVLWKREKPLETDKIPKKWRQKTKKDGNNK